MHDGRHIQASSVNALLHYTRVSQAGLSISCLIYKKSNPFITSLFITIIVISTHSSNIDMTEPPKKPTNIKLTYFDLPVEIGCSPSLFAAPSK